MNNDAFRAKILFSLARKRKWSESHTAYENMFRVFKTESLGKDGLKFIKNLAEELTRDGFIMKKQTHYGLQISLNPRKSQEIKKLIKDNLGYDV